MKLLPSEKRLLALLAFVQFTQILDFVIMMPLAPQLMRSLGMSTTEFGLNVSAYTWSASIFGFVSAFFIDRFDRKRALLSLYAGFIIGTAFCAVATSSHFLLIARIVAGAFGGMMAASTFTIVGDLIPAERRGTAMGIVMSSFSVASVAGVPIGLFLASHWSWHIPFAGLAILSAIVLVACSIYLPPVRGHLKGGQAQQSIKQIKEILLEKRHYWTFLFLLLIFFAAFSIIPFIAAYMVSNVHLTEKDLPLVYLFGGGFTFFSSQYIGRLADRYGKRKIFYIVATLSTIPILILTHLPVVPTFVAIVVTTLFMMSTSGRFVPAMAMVTSSIEPYRRGGFMNLTSTVQNLGAGIASYFGGLVIEQSSTGEILHFGDLGWIAVLTTFLCMFAAKRIRELHTKPTQDLKSPGHSLG